MRFIKVARAVGRVHALGRHYQLGFWQALRRAHRLQKNALFSIEDMAFWGLLNPALPLSEVEKYPSREARVRLERFFNDASVAYQLNDKAEFYVLAQELDLPVPQFFGVFRAATPGAGRRASSKAADCKPESLRIGSYVAKPAWADEGHGIQFFERNENGFLCDAGLLSSEEISVELCRVSGEDLVVQSRVRPHPQLASVSNTEGLQCVRLVSYLQPDDHVHILFTRFKFLVGGNLIDNFGDGSSGNLFAAVDTDTGMVQKVFGKHPGRVGLVEVDQHPDTGSPLHIRLPDWGAVRLLVERAAKSFPRLPLVGWDIALTSAGPVIIEGNLGWGVTPVAAWDWPEAHRKQWVAATKKRPAR